MTAADHQGGRRNLGYWSLSVKLFGAGFARIKSFGSYVKEKVKNATFETFAQVIGDINLSKEFEVFNFNYDRDSGKRNHSIPVYGQEEGNSTFGIDVTCDDCFSFADLTFTIEVQFSEDLDGRGNSSTRDAPRN